MQECLQEGMFCPDTCVGCEPMFDSKTKLSERLADAVDLLIDFATLGEYGLEPVSEPARTDCVEGRRRSAGALAYDRLAPERV